MHTFTTGWIDTKPPPHPGIQTTCLRARDYGDGYTLRALIADADQAGDPWLAFTNVAPLAHQYLAAQATVFVRGRNCDFLELTNRGTVLCGTNLTRNSGW